MIYFEKYLCCLQMVKVFVENMLPFQIVESPSFQEFVTTCIPFRKNMSRRTRTRRIEDEYVNVMYIIM